jgi:hypothetical protein
MKYLTVADVQFIGDLKIFEERTSALADALLDLEDADRSVEDPDVAANLATGRVDVQMTITAEDPAEAATKALCTLRAAIHAIGDATPGWETSTAVMHVAPVGATERLVTA